MTVYRRGDIVIVPFPFSNQISTKKRPAVVVSSDAYNNSSADIVIMAITGKIEKTIRIDECFIEDWHEAGLLKPSLINQLYQRLNRHWF
ncbi:MAG: type II toxin-antitoxin system PemK/MazF family toxin [Deltaproteobacteria bacterium]|nr:type II toxin-antitoxin system PemK/MazF family toxin [Deltaproteobacteria bacterium]